MEKLLFLSHRIPYPPNKGDKIRSFNILNYLKDHYEIYLGTFIDDPNDEQYQADLSAYTIEQLCLPLSRSGLSQAIGAVKAIAQNKPITLPCFYSNKMQTWVDNILEQHNISKVFIFCSSMAQYVDKHHHGSLTRIIDFVDIDSDKWRQYAQSKSFPMSAVYAREHKKLAKYEQQIAQQFNTSFFVSEQEAEMFKSLTSHSKIDVQGIPNGVDTNYFNPSDVTMQSLEINNDLAAQDYLVFTGAMDYWANAEAVIWFTKHVWPSICDTHPNLKFYIVGGNPTPAVQALACDSIIVTGRVDDIRPYITHSLFTLAPLRIARGIQNKVLEAMAMGKVSVMTTMAAEGINLPTEQQSYITDDASEMIAKIQYLLAQPDEIKTLGQGNRQWIETHYQWNAVLTPLLTLFEE